MSFYISIKKIRELSNKEGLYEVKTYENVFLIKINIERKTVEIINDSMSAPYIIDFNDPEKEINIEWLSSKAIHTVIVKSKRVIDAQALLEDISFLRWEDFFDEFLENGCLKRI